MNKKQQKNGYINRFSGKIRLIYLILIITASVSLVSFIIFRELYCESVANQGEWLANTAKSQARLIEAVDRFGKDHNREVDHTKEVEKTTLSQIIDAHEQYEGFGKTGEFALAKRDGDKIVFVMRHRHHYLEKYLSIPFDSNLAQPMRNALSGISGSGIELDYRGVEVLAAYEPVNEINIGIVAKMDLDEIRHPFVIAGIKATILATIVIVIGSGLFIRITNPLIHNLQLSESRIRAVLENAAEGIITTNERGIVDSLNLAAAQMFRYDSGELTGLQINSIIPGLIDKPEENGIAPASTHLKHEIESINKETSGIRKDGTGFFMKVSVSRTVFRNNLLITIIVQDITGRKNVEKELKLERGNLERIVEDRTRELRQSLDTLTESNLRLEEANLAKARFLSSMSHELRTPLNAILGFCDLLKGQFFGKLNDKQLEYSKQIDTSGKHLLSLINDLLDMAKIDAGAIELELEEVQASEFINVTVSMMKTQFNKKRIKVETMVDNELPLILADRRKVKQIMLNLLSNAVKYTPNDGYIKVKAFKDMHSQIKITVTDNGIGIKIEEIEKIFSEFHQADHVRDEQLGGTGIGLALTRRLVELHSGEIGVESELNKGSTFWFTLPAKSKFGNKGIDNKPERNVT